MRCIPSHASVAATGLLLAVLALPIGGQEPVKIPTISSRYFVSGSAKVTVSGSFQIDQDVAINTAASYGDGEYTWLQFGISGSEAPNALITYGDGVGINVGRGKRTVTAEGDHCTGKVEVTKALVSGLYTCVGVISYDAATRQMGKVDIQIRFTAKS